VWCQLFPAGGCLCCCAVAVLLLYCCCIAELLSCRFEDVARVHAVVCATTGKMLTAVLLCCFYTAAGSRAWRVCMRLLASPSC
jgi:hypothetical protein